MAEKPKTQKEQIDTLWQTVVGNDADGLATMVKRNSTQIGEIKEDVAFIRGKLEGGGPDRRTIAVRRVLESGVTAIILGVIVVGVVLLVAGRLTPEDIANILRAWKGGP